MCGQPLDHISPAPRRLDRPWSEQIVVATEAVDYPSEHVQRRLLALHKETAAVPEVIKPAPPFWLDALLSHVARAGAYPLTPEGLLAREHFYPAFRAWLQEDVNGVAEAQGNFGFGPGNGTDPSGSILYAEFTLYVHRVQEPAACIAFVGELADLCEAATADGLRTYALGLPFYRCERYVKLQMWCLRGIGVALGVVFGVTVLFIGTLRESFIMVVSLTLNLVQLAGLLAFAGMKVNGALVMAIVASIGCASEYAGHFVMAFLQARGTKSERVAFAYARSFHPLLDSAVSTILGIAMIAFAAFPFVVKYFFVPMVVLTVLNLVNAVVFLPVLLRLFGGSRPWHPGSPGSSTASPLGPGVYSRPLEEGPPAAEAPAMENALPEARVDSPAPVTPEPAPQPFASPPSSGRRLVTSPIVSPNPRRTPQIVLFSYEEFEKGTIGEML